MKDLRQTKIISWLEREGTKSIKDLSDAFKVSEMTIRRDVAELSEKGIIVLKNGWVNLNSDLHREDERISDYTVESATKYMINEKRRIAEYAASMVRNDESIIIDNGTTMDFFASYLNDHLTLTVLTCNINAANRLIRKKNINLMLTGGEYHAETAMFTSPEGVSLINRMRGNKVFISASGIHESLGITCTRTYEIEVKQAMMASGSQKILLVDSSKFGDVQRCHFANLENFDTIVTDDGINDDFKQLVEEKGVELIIV